MRPVITARFFKYFRPVAALTGLAASILSNEYAKEFSLGFLISVGQNFVF